MPDRIGRPGVLRGATSHPREMQGLAQQRCTATLNTAHDVGGCEYHFRVLLATSRSGKARISVGAQSNGSPLVLNPRNRASAPLGEPGVSVKPIVQRYIWPGGMDLMARMAGLTLVERWGGWSRERFDSDSMLQVAVYGR